MKKLLLLFAFCAWNGHAQGTFDFTVYLNAAYVVPPSSTQADGSGTLRLTGSSLSYDITTDYTLWPGYIYGPAEPGMNGPALFRLRPTVCDLPLPGAGGHDGYCLYRGSETVTQQQASELVSGLWYVQFTSTASSALAMRGQILLVPEPPISLLLAVAICAGAVLVRRGIRTCPQGNGSKPARTR